MIMNTLSFRGPQATAFFMLRAALLILLFGSHAAAEAPKFRVHAIKRGLTPPETAAG